jgi:glycosyltransferase involved in cell wall biosynthesis
MRIALVTDNFYPEIGGIQESIMLNARTLGELGHRVAIFAPSASEADFRVSHLPVKEIDLGPNVCVERIFSFSVPSNTQQSRLVPPTLVSLRRMRAFKPDVIHTQGFFGLGLDVLWAKKILGVPFVGTNHWAIGEFNMYSFIDPERFARWSTKAVTWYYNHCDFMSAPSQSVITEMVKFGLRIPHEVVSNPIDTVVFRPPQPGMKETLKQKFKFSRATMVYAGRFALEKYIDVLIRALAIVAKDVPEAILALAGHGSDRPRLEALARELSVADKVRFLGTLSKPDLAEAFQAADVFTIASTSETQCMALLQAMNCGLPSVVVNWRAFPEYVTPERGFLARVHDPVDFAAKLKTVFEDDALRARLGQSAEPFAKNFSAASVAHEWERIYSMYRR